MKIKLRRGRKFLTRFLQHGMTFVFHVRIETLSTRWVTRTRIALIIEVRRRQYRQLFIVSVVSVSVSKHSDRYLIKHKRANSKFTQFVRNILQLA